MRFGADLEKNPLTKYSAVLPDGSLTPPPNIVVEVLCTWGVVGRVCPFEPPAPPFLTVFPWSQLLDAMVVLDEEGI